MELSGTGPLPTSGIGPIPMGVLACTVCAPLLLVIQGPSKFGATSVTSALCEVQLFHFYIAFVSFAVLNAARQAKI